MADIECFHSKSIKCFGRARHKKRPDICPAFWKSVYEILFVSSVVGYTGILGISNVVCLTGAIILCERFILQVFVIGYVTVEEDNVTALTSPG